MLDLLLVNTRVHLRFFARNRLLLGLALVVLFVLSLSMVPAMIFGTSIGRFELLRAIDSQLNGFTLLATAGLGLFAVSHHVRGRSLKMVLTKPCSPEIWLASVFLSGALVSAGLYAVSGLVVAGLSLALGVPYQSGFTFIAVDGFFRAMIWFSYLTALAVAFHPVLAVLIAGLLNEETFYGLKFLIAGGAKAEGLTLLLMAAGAITDAVYFVLPMVQPLSQRTEEIYASLRTASGDWGILGQIAAYAFLAVTFFYCVSDYLIRRKSLA